MSLRQLTGALGRGAVPSRAVAVTFDDGYADNLFHAKPLLERHDIPATIFIASGYTGKKQEFWWDELERLILHSPQLPEALCLTIAGKERHWTLGDDAVYSQKQFEENSYWRAAENPLNNRQKLYLAIWRLLLNQAHPGQQQILGELALWAKQPPGGRDENRPLSKEELISLGQSKQIEIGAHTVTHSLLTAHPVSLQQKEVLQSKKQLEEILGLPVNHFSYPYGDYGEDTISCIRRGGFVSACTTEARTVKAGTNPFKLPRFQVPDYDGETFKKKLAQWFGK